MSYILELQSEGEVINSAYAFTLQEVRTIARMWKPRHRRLVFNSQPPRKKTMLAEGGQCIAEFRLPSLKMAYIYVMPDTETIERHFARSRQ